MKTLRKPVLNYAISAEQRSRQLLVRPTTVRSGSKRIRVRAWPSVAEWTKCRRGLVARTFRRLGIEPKRYADIGLWASQVLNVLGPDSFVEFTAVSTCGKVIWCNFDLARQLGFEVPRLNQLTPGFEKQLLAALSFRVVSPTENVQSQKTITMYADRYGGDGVWPALGAGRAGFLPYGNLYVKGVGLTPLFRHNDPDDFEHSHGAVHFDDCLLEAVFGEVNENLFARGSARVLAIIDEGRHVTPPSGPRMPVALVARTGVQLRPAHLLNRHLSRNGSRLETFIKIARATGQLVTRQNNGASVSDVPNIKETMLRIIDDHARTAAEGFRWRMIHGALSSSNMEMSGAMLDVPTQSTQPRTAPIWCLDREYFAFGAEHIERAVQLTPAYRALMRNTPRSQRDRFHIKWINVAREMDKAYSRHLQVQLLRAAGLKTEVARRIQAERAELADRFTDLILQMVSLKNPGTTHTSKSAVESVSVLDVFNLLGSLPRKYFMNPSAGHTKNILKYLKPVFRGNRFHVAKKRAAVKALVDKFAHLYRELMNACSDIGKEYYCDMRQMQASIEARAAFENRPIDSLYYYKLLKDFKETIAVYRSTGNSAVISEAIDRRISASMRNVEALLGQGISRRMTGGGIELGMRTIGGINYSVKAWNDKKNTRRLHISIPVARVGNHYSSAVLTLPRLTKKQISSLRYRFTTDGWKNTDQVRGRLRLDARDGVIIDFEDICSFPLVGRLEGTFDFRGRGNLCSGDESAYSGGYTFAIPDRQELMKIATAQEG
jgi:hypothetical protein